MSRPLTARQREALWLVIGELYFRGRPPTIRELQRLLGQRSTFGTRWLLGALKREGYIEWDPVTARGLRVLREP